MRTLRLPGALSALFVLAGTYGCTATVVDAAPDGGGAVTTQALILMERSERDGKTAQTNISAKFLRAPVAADSDAVERIVGSELDLPAVGECMIVPASEDAAADPSAVGPIELFDVGDVTIRTPTGEISLAARAFPDVGDRVSGMFYTSPDAARDLPAPGKYTLESSGLPGVDRFIIETEAPAAPADVTVGGAPLTEGAELVAGDLIDVTWRATPADRSRAADAPGDDLAYVEIVAENGVAARCTFEDRGRGTLPASLFTDAAFGPLPMAATVAVHRVRQGTFQVTAIDVGEVRFDLSVIAGVTLQPARLARDVRQSFPLPRTP